LDLLQFAQSTAVEYAIQFSSSANGVINSATFKALNADTTIPRTVRIWLGNSQVASLTTTTAASGVLTADLTTPLYVTGSIFTISEYLSD